MVDDDESNRDMLGRRLQRDGYTVQLAANGVEALRLLRSSAFDLVLLDLIMSGLDGYQVLLKMKNDPALREIPVIMLSALDQEGGIARCIELGAEDYDCQTVQPGVSARAHRSLPGKKTPARQGTADLRGAPAKRETPRGRTGRRRGVCALAAAGAAGRRSAGALALPTVRRTGRRHFRLSLDQRRQALAIYLLDVSGHGVGAALLSVSVFNVLRTQSLQGTDFADPAAVLNQLNRVFPMERQNNLLFTIWYGVFDKTTRQLAYASGGHPPAALVEPGGFLFMEGGGPGVRLRPRIKISRSPPPGPRGSKLYVFSDGAFEIVRADGSTVQLPEFIQQFGKAATEGTSKLDELVAWARAFRGEATLEDDLSIMELEL